MNHYIAFTSSLCDRTRAVLSGNSICSVADHPATPYLFDTKSPKPIKHQSFCKEWMHFAFLPPYTDTFWIHFYSWLNFRATVWWVKKNAPPQAPHQRCPHLNIGKLWVYYLTRQRRVKFADSIRLLIADLKMGRLSWIIQLSPMEPQGSLRGEENRSEWLGVNRIPLAFAGFCWLWRWRKGPHLPRNVGHPLGSGSYPEPPERNAAWF